MWLINLRTKGMHWKQEKTAVTLLKACHHNVTVDRLYGDVPTHSTLTHIHWVVRDYFRMNSDCWAVLKQVNVEIVGVHFVFEKCGYLLSSFSPPIVQVFSYYSSSISDTDHVNQRTEDPWPFISGRGQVVVVKNKNVDCKKKKKKLDHHLGVN